jgi:hypothetical protein
MRTGFLQYCARGCAAALILALTLVVTVRATDMSEFIHDTQRTLNQGNQVTPKPPRKFALRFATTRSLRWRGPPPGCKG